MSSHENEKALRPFYHKKYLPTFIFYQKYFS